ncbi:unnamed protein product [Didymodactylos carnosus]|uniref:Uncharacterized protein n=1 Tax=Didymodactylos carnosus TaxID=1234261 RepID=A0A814RH08_9BILA|nr:unnamed protein product [Didymodactylos carnosus]CAF3896038.1 unnamed protein product [Didymodactylos carnosus]
MREGWTPLKTTQNYSRAVPKLSLLNDTYNNTPADGVWSIGTELWHTHERGEQRQTPVLLRISSEVPEQAEIVIQVQTDTLENNPPKKPYAPRLFLSNRKLVTLQHRNSSVIGKQCDAKSSDIVSSLSPLRLTLPSFVTRHATIPN